MSDAALRRAIGNSFGRPVFLGAAETQRQASMRPAARGRGKTRPRRGGGADGGGDSDGDGGRFVPLTYPTGDEDAGGGFRVCGFKNGKRVYRLQSRHQKQLQASVVKTAVGLCYLDVAAMLPPQVVAAAAAAAAAAGAEELGAGLARLSVDASEASATTGTASLASLTSTASTPPPSVRPPPPPTLHVNGCFAIRPSALGGLGSFALRPLARGEHILVERPLVRTNLFHLTRELERLAPAQRAAFDALAGHHPDPRASAAERIWTANTFVAGSLEGVFALASRFNHACAPRNNVGYRYDRGHNVLVMTALGRIAAGAELLISYGKTPRMLFQRFGFGCTCGACAGFSEEAPGW